MLRKLRLYSSRLAGAIYRMRALPRLGNQLSELSHSVNELGVQMNQLAKLQREANNLLQQVNGSMHTRLNVLDNVHVPALKSQMHELMALQYNIFNVVDERIPKVADDKEHYQMALPVPWDEILARAESEFGSVYQLWKNRLNATLEAFQTTKVGNAAWGGDAQSRIFRGFVERYALGRILDVGCGIFGRPYYLASYPAELISGLDPLPSNESTDFEFVRGISEYLPWPDGSFSTVISATSLDHCLSLERSLNEIQRVLRPKGRFLLWISSIPGAAKYEPNAPDFVPSDQYHLFHFDAGWFQPMLMTAFDVVDRIELQCVNYSSIMYCLERHPLLPPKDGSQ